MTSWAFVASVGLLLLFIAAGTVRSGLLLRGWLPPHNLLLSWPDNILRLVVAGLCLALGLRIGPGPGALAWATGRPVGDLLLGLCIGLLLALLLGLAGTGAASRWGADVYSSRTLQLILPINRREWAGVLLALFPAAALEELLFRWLPLTGLAWLVPPWWLMWPLSLFFGALHWPQGWWGVAGTTLAAIALSLLFLATGSLWPPLFAHYTMNLAQIVQAHLAGVKPMRG